MSWVWLVLVLFGTFLEGEFSILGVMYFASEEIHWSWLIGPAWIGAFLGDWLFFELGVRNGQSVLARYARIRHWAQKTSDFLGRYPRIAVFVLRFQIGMRMLGCFALGHSGVSRRRFLTALAPATLLWAVSIPVMCRVFLLIVEALLARFPMP
ncbi:VTT domain-containing protein [Sulfidibacter corallicola]|uniref:VTT domain-containing protein n=1 Tax=Sulfidibacter corallicola TaxID=2818388 RepID=A0A8A4TTA2_SULCO|nr:hypothetical protein [Sulfidibacter corallicola]QTD52318.1 VTT domain-containing protein [Sulfidibacter corallicola]